MTPRDPVQCPVCGWTGQDSDLDRIGGEPTCPACDESIALD